MNTPLDGKNIILGITGGIAAYKAAVLTRLLVKAGASVQVVMTPNAKEFICPLTLSTLSQKPVISEFFTANTGQWNSHVDLGLWAHAMIVAPATASTIAKMANGVADNMLVTTYLSAKCPVFVAPAMDLDMMRHPTTVRNIELLRSYGNHIIDSTTGYLASNLVGKGRMAEPEDIVKAMSDFFACKADLAGKRVLITAGPTVEPIDPVRYISNFSTGKMGYALANECARRGADVTLVSGPVSIPRADSTVNTVNVTTAREMLDACLEHFDKADITILTAAVADYAPAKCYDRKIKRNHTDLSALPLVKNPDIAATLGERKRPDQLLVGFALETDNEITNATEKLERKNLDAIVLNSLADSGAGFATDTNTVTYIDRAHNHKRFPLKPKTEIAHDIADCIVDHITKTHNK